MEKNRGHVDIAVADVDAAMRRIEALDGRLLHEVVDPDMRFLVAADPDGKEFCIVPDDA